MKTIANTLPPFVALFLIATSLCVTGQEYYSVHVGPGYSTIANDLDRGVNTLNRVLPAVADGTQLFKFNPGTQTFEVDEFWEEFGWLEDLTLSPGDGAWIYSPVGQTLILTGETHVRQYPRPPPGWYLFGPRNYGPTNYEQALGFPPAIGDRVIFYRSNYAILAVPPAQASSIHTLGPKGWDTAPQFQVGKSFYVQIASGTNNPVNTPPRIDSVPDETVHAGTLMTLKILAWDIESNRLSYALGPNAPAGARIDPTSGRMTFQTSMEDVGLVHRIEVQVTDDGAPPMSSMQSFNVTVGPPLHVLSMNRMGQGLEIEWSAIPGKQYVIRSKGNLSDPYWRHEAVVTADSSPEQYVFVPENPDSTLYMVTCTSDPGCGCEAMTFEAIKPTTGQVKFTVNSCRQPREEQACSVKVEIPFALLGTLDCDRGSKECEGNLTITLTGATWQFINAETGANVGGAIAEAGGWSKSMKPHAPCDEVSDYSEKVTYTTTITVEGAGVAGLQDPTNRKKLKTGEIVLRGTLQFRICWQCGSGAEVCRDFALAVDGRGDLAGSRQGGFDLGDSDFDGDGRDGDGANQGPNNDPNAADADPYDPAVR